MNKTLAAALIATLGMASAFAQPVVTTTTPVPETKAMAKADAKAVKAQGKADVATTKAEAKADVKIAKADAKAHTKAHKAHAAAVK